METLKGKVALVTGAGSGIGEAIAIAYAAEGADLAISDIDQAWARRTAEKAVALGARAVGIRADCGDVASINDMVSRTVAEFGRVDIIVNNAGVTRPAYIMDLNEEDWDKTHRVNAKGVFFCIQAAAREMIRQGDGGRVINIASIAGRGYSGASNAIYAASKGAVIALTKTASQQLGRHNINVNSICPGATLTELATSVYELAARESGVTLEQMVSEAQKRIPIGRANSAEDIAAMAVFLASTGARNITGQCYNVDGGQVPS
ncbi:MULTISPECIES: glucose 1-dehydrogenase [unclassified Variovorax]|uniref:SDR family NAD(P)-dependent oxidoreductase n=1 Tax=unclassified Variovorax TaxID=663243 RepID=UPI00076CE3A7|nr:MULTISPECIES: glucose 1-dehydrogenase [unclassified Variovorax]KWT97667.1 3-oxoacyl-[acyl-carrier protein] reductase [Variovorax sp. WDL1]PNG48765.1 Sorbitol dehydrogenase [Variovorax sp. B2]PNG49270.1 Sorbitol dehydrogenase [Variovorax sp. B4]VTV18460.1 Sorbitol dehydrogenase [Variovorax sp. WDL1]